jgi:predicted dienelactone hydrolase
MASPSSTSNNPGSDAAVYRTPGTPQERRARIRAAASAEQLQARIGDAGFILDELGRRRREGSCDLTRLGRTRVGFAGHSMGAWTTQGLAGQRFFGTTPFRDPRIKAAIAFSPSALTTANLGDSFGAITIPFFSITGTRDGAIIRPAKSPPDLTAEAQRTGPFTGMSPGQKYLLVFKDGDHMVFSGSLRRAPTATDSHIQTVKATTTSAFWGMTLLARPADGKALAALPASLAPGDRFEAKQRCRRPSALLTAARPAGCRWWPTTAVAPWA